MSMIDRDAVLEALSAWARSHPEPDIPCLVSMGDPSDEEGDHEFESTPAALTPKDFLREVEDGTPLGKSYLAFLESQAEQYDVRAEEFVWRAVRANQTVAA